jgi:hypothetical protein
MKNIQRHDAYVVMIPPTGGPMRVEYSKWVVLL